MGDPFAFSRLAVVGRFPKLPFGGYKPSGAGRESGWHGREARPELKTITLHLGPCIWRRHRPDRGSGKPGGVA